MPALPSLLYLGLAAAFGQLWSRRGFHLGSSALLTQPLEKKSLFELVSSLTQVFFKIYFISLPRDPVIRLVQFARLKDITACIIL